MAFSPKRQKLLGSHLWQVISTFVEQTLHLKKIHIEVLCWGEVYSSSFHSLSLDLSLGEIQCSSLMGQIIKDSFYVLSKALSLLVEYFQFLMFGFFLVFWSVGFPSGSSMEHQTPSPNTQRRKRINRVWGQVHLKSLLVRLCFRTFTVGTRIAKSCKGFIGRTPINFALPSLPQNYSTAESFPLGL